MSATDNPIVQAVVEDHDALARAWSAFRAADSARDYCERWLEYLQLQHPGIHGGVVLLAGEDESNFAPLAHWPQTFDLVTVADCAEQALKDGGREAMLPSGAGLALAFPIYLLGGLQALVVFEVSNQSPEHLRQDLRASLAWLEVLLLKRGMGTDETPKRPIYLALECVGAVVDKADFQTGANALVSELATLLECDRASLALIEGDSAKICAISDTAVFGQQMNIVGLIEAAMDEAIDQGETVVWPPRERNAFLITLAHDKLSQHAADSTICTVPLIARNEPVGALLLEHNQDKDFDERTVQLLEVVASLCAAPLIDRRDAERNLVVLAGQRFSAQARRLFGPGYSGRKVFGAAVLALVSGASLITDTYRVTGEALLRGAQQRAITAPIDGYVDTAPARAGDRLDGGVSLLTLDDRDIQIERLKLATERSQLQQQRKQAVAARERASVKVFDAQIEQANARLALLDEQITRTHVNMPFEGFVVSGDFSQSLGAPVRRGDLLFEVAPSNAYRLIVDVDESQLDEVQTGARGVLRLNALPDHEFSILVTRITPVTKAFEGGNYFEVEAQLEGENARLRPGMRGIGKIEIGERKLVWIWTRAMRAWLTLQWWRWWP